jgi:AcrR family transcriptional regulator
MNDGNVRDMGAPAGTMLTTEHLDSVRRIVLEHVVAGREVWNLARIADAAHAPEPLLRARFGALERLVDEVVAGVLRRARPFVRAEQDVDTDLGLVIADLVRSRLVVHEHVRTVWHLIGQGDASTLEFDALRSTLLATVECLLDRRLAHFEPDKRVEAIKLVDGWLNLASIHNLRSESAMTFRAATSQLTAELITLFDTLGVTDASDLAVRQRSD